MALYNYKAVNPDGRMVLGRIDAINLVDLEMRLRRMELDLVSGEPLRRHHLVWGGGVPRREIIHCCFHLQQLVRAGVPIIEGLTDLRDSLEHPRFREVVAGLIESIEGGQALFLRDTNGDDRADERRTLFRGWGMGDTHATASNIRTGSDNWIWGVLGYSGFDGDVGGRRMKFGMGVFRFKPP